MRRHISESGTLHAEPNSRPRGGRPRAAGVGIGVIAAAALLLCAPPFASAQALPRSVTLITGDRVVVSGKNLESVSIQRASGRERIRFVTHRLPARAGQAAHLFVIPDDALPLIAADKVDRRLFDVSLLIEHEYDDARRDNLPLIVTYEQSTARRSMATTSRSVAGFALTTRERMVWTFDSAHAPDGEEPLLLLTVRFDPALSERGRAPRGRQFVVPFRVVQFGNDAEPHVKKPKVEVSYDDGQTWARVPVEKDGSCWNALLDHPRRAEYVSLRASAHDRDGNGVEQTLIRAYALGGRR